MSLAQRRAERVEQIARQLVEKFDGTGVPYTCAAVVRNAVEQRAIVLCHEAEKDGLPHIRPARCVNRALAIVHERWRAQSTPQPGRTHG